MIDTSALLAVLLNEPERPAVIAATRGVQLLAAPSLPWEVGNALVSLRRRRRANAEEVQKTWRTFLTVPVRLVDIEVPDALRLAEEHNLYAYDAYVLQAARTTRAPVAALDQKLIRAARASGIRVQEVST